MIPGYTNGSGDTPSGNLAVQLTGDGVDTQLPTEQKNQYSINIDEQHTSRDYVPTPPSADEASVDESIVVEVADEKNDEAEEEEEEEVVYDIEGSDWTAMNEVTSSYSCGGGNSAAATKGGTKQLIQFDYDMLVPQSSSEKKPINDILQQFEEQLLNNIGLRLDKAGLCNNVEEVRKVMLRRHLVGGGDSSSSLEELTSLPIDKVAEDAKCTTALTNIDGTSCYPIKGYMTAYYSSNSSANNEIEMKIQDVIQQSMDSFSFTTPPTDSSKSFDIAGVHFVGVRQGGASVKESPLIVSEQSQASLSKPTLILGLIVGGGLIVLLMVVLAIRWYIKYSKGGSDTSVESNDATSISKDDGHLVDLTLEYTYSGESTSDEEMSVVRRRSPRNLEGTILFTGDNKAVIVPV